MKICYIYASRSRPQKFFEGLDNIRTLSSNKDYKIIAKLDTDDKTMNTLEVKKKLEQYPEVIVKWGRSSSKIHAINRDNEETKDCDIIINFSDDMRFVVPGFDRIIKHYMTDLDRFLHFPDSYKKAAVCTMSIMGRTYFERTGLIYPSEYNSLWADNEATEVAKLLDCYTFINTQIFEHNHFSNWKAERDLLYHRNNTFRTDYNTYDFRKRRNFGLPFKKDPFLLIKYATRGRWRLFVDAIENIHQTIRTNQFRIIVTADEDDVEMNCGEIKEICKRYPNVQLIYGPRVSKIEAINRETPVWPWEWCLVMSDDMKFVEYGWDKKMWEQIRNVWPEGTDFFAHFSDGFVNEKLPTMNICGRKYYERFGYIYHPCYKAVSCDAENMFVAQMLGKYHYFPDVYFRHMHPANLKQPSDRTYRENDKHGDSDTAVYFERMSRGFDVKGPVMIPAEVKKRMK
jgi:hypothetical protein